jgi:hypothetical protein
MPIIRTVFRPWEELDVDEAEAAAMARQGLLTPDAPEEVNTDGDTEEEGSGGEASGLPEHSSEDRAQTRRRPRSRAADPRLADPQGQPGSEAGQPEPEEGSPIQEEGLTG